MGKKAPMMRFFTRGWHHGELTDDEYENTLTRYASHLTALREHLPERLAELAVNISLNDAGIRRARWDGNVFNLELRTGNLQSGYFDLTLVYGDVVSLRGKPDLGEILNDPNAEILNDEVDRNTANEFEHRLLFVSGGEIVVRFRKFDFSSLPAESLEFDRERPVFVNTSERVGLEKGQ